MPIYNNLSTGPNSSIVLPFVASQSARIDVPNLSGSESAKRPGNPKKVLYYKSLKIYSFFERGINIGDTCIFDFKKFSS